ncbi:hypothetical protein VTL71DRAFT_11691 [Oculimacula yallundae]|uniref:Secreted protein n=1 Tax=Oculimacula yallundae TaxID=86028 RepID=A0ABR4CQT3_9HELO
MLSGFPEFGVVVLVQGLFSVLAPRLARVQEAGAGLGLGLGWDSDCGCPTRRDIEDIEDIAPALQHFPSTASRIHRTALDILQ